jgi:hypothetical protein
MQTNTMLGQSLGQLLSDTFNGTAATRGRLDGYRMKELQTQAELQQGQLAKVNAETDNIKRVNDLANDSNLGRTALMLSGINGDEANTDYADYLKNGRYTPKTKPLAFIDGGTELPTPEYVNKFADTAKAQAQLRAALAIGNKNLDLNKVIQGIQRNNMTADLTPENAMPKSLSIAALDGSDPSKITEASLMQSIANGGDYGTFAKALLAGKGNGMFDSFDGGVTNVLDGTQSINGIGKSNITKNNASANNFNASAQDHLAGVALKRAKTVNETKGGGKNFDRVRDDIRADYNAMYPVDRDKSRPIGAPDFNTFTKQWLKQNNIDENQYFNNSGQANPNPIVDNKPKEPTAYEKYKAAFDAAAGNPEIQKQITERARKNKVVK